MSEQFFKHAILVFFLLAFVQCSKVLNQVCNKCSQIIFTVEQGMQDKFLADGRTLKTVTVRSDSECFLECSFDCLCMSFSVCGKTCQLNAGSQYLVRNSLQPRTGCRYYDFPTFRSSCNFSANPLKHCCGSSSLLCLNGGTCVVDISDTTRRFKCECPTGYYGNQCEVKTPRTCLDYWTDQLKPTSGQYTIVDSTKASYEVFCDFDSEEDLVWTLFESFDIANETALIKKSFAVNFPLNVHSLNWQLFRLPKSVMSEISTHSTFWRATCSYSVFGVDFRDYIRVRLSIMNPLNFTGYFHTDKNPCLTVDYFDIKGTKCEGCTQTFFQDAGTSPGHALHLKPANSRNKRNCSFDSSKAEYKCSGNGGTYAHLLGLYSKNCLDPEHRCSASVNATTEFWFGAYRKSQLSN